MIRRFVAWFVLGWILIGFSFPATGLLGVALGLAGVASEFLAARTILPGRSR